MSETAKDTAAAVVDGYCDWLQIVLTDNEKAELRKRIAVALIEFLQATRSAEATR